jgi:hypothetical protein
MLENICLKQTEADTGRGLYSIKEVYQYDETNKKYTNV